MATIPVKDANNTTVNAELPLPPGQALMAASRPVAIASNQTAVPVSGTITINAIPAGSANIGDVDIASMPNQYTEGTPMPADPVGPSLMARRRSVLSAEASPDGVAIALNCTSTGQLHTLAELSGSSVIGQSGIWDVRMQDGGGQPLTSATRGGERALSVQIVDNAGVQVTSFGGAPVFTEDAALPADPSATPLIARRRDTLTAAEVSADGDAIVLNATSKGQLHVLAEIPASQLGAVGPQTKANSTSVTMATDEQIAHGTFDGGNPTKIGGKAYSTHPVYAGDQTRSHFITDRVGKQIAVNAIRELKGSQATQCVITGETIIIPAGGAGKFRDLYGLVMANTSSVTINATVRDAGGSGTVKSTWVLPPGDTRGFTLDAGSAMRQDSANNDWTVALSTLPSGSVHVTALWIENI